MKVVIYGCGRRYYNLFDWFEYVDLGMIKHEIEVVGFSDGNPAVWGERVLYSGKSFEIRNIKEYLENDYDKIMVISKDFFEEICDDLIRQGYKKEIIFLIDEIFEPNLELISSGCYFTLYKQWAEFCESESNLALFFQAGNYKDIAIYGSGKMSELLIRICSKSDIRVRYLIGSNSGVKHGYLPIYQIDTELPQVDIIVVSTTENYMWIEKEICRKNGVEVISIQEVIFKTLKNARRN